MSDSGLLPLRQKYAIPDAEWAEVQSHFARAEYAKNQSVIQPGDSARRVGFVGQGLFRIYYLDPDGTESTKAFRAEGDLIALYAEILRKEPSRSTLQAIEESVVYWIDYDVVDALAVRSIFWAQLLRRLAETQFLIKDRREREFLQQSATERLESFERTFPGHARIPRFMVASYLGITNVALSRISSASVKSRK